MIARAHFDTVRLPFPPVAIQRAGLVIGAPLGYPETARQTSPASGTRPHSRPLRTYDRRRPHTTGAAETR